MHYVWTGKWPENRVPRIDSVKLDNKTRFDNIHLKADKDYLLNIYAYDYENDPLKLKIEILPDIPEYYRGDGDHEERPPTIIKTENEEYSHGLTIKAPTKEGPYRVFIYVTDGQNNAGTANIPVFVDKS